MDWQVPGQQFHTPYHQNPQGIGMAHGSYQTEGQPFSKRLGYL